MNSISIICSSQLIYYRLSFFSSIEQERKRRNQRNPLPFLKSTFVSISIVHRIHRKTILEFTRLNLEKVMQIIRRLVINHAQSLIPMRRYFSILHSDSFIMNQMKQFNDDKKYDQVLQLFDKYTKDNNPKSIPSRIATQAIKACTQMGDLKRAKDIHRRLSSSITSDPYISSSLINVYRKPKDFSSIKTFSSSLCF